jgi:ABC-type antimicrobial peptide transport system permease subunit
MAYNVRRQRREFGSRLALGADGRRVTTLVIARGVLLAGAGIASGALGAWLLTGVLRQVLNDVKPTEPGMFAAAAASMLAFTVAACYIPARAAGRVDPMIVLRDS